MKFKTGKTGEETIKEVEETQAALSGENRL